MAAKGIGRRRIEPQWQEYYNKPTVFLWFRETLNKRWLLFHALFPVARMVLWMNFKPNTKGIEQEKTCLLRVSLAKHFCLLPKRLLQHKLGPQQPPLSYLSSWSTLFRILFNPWPLLKSVPVVLLRRDGFNCQRTLVLRRSLSYRSSKTLEKRRATCWNFWV